MSAPHPLNQAVLAQALHDMRNGQLRRCLTMGFTAKELEVLKQPAMVAVLADARVPWCSVKINPEILWRLVLQVNDIEREIAVIDRMLRLEASTEMVSEYYGLTHQEVALRRDILQLPKRKGRHPVLSEAQETSLWRDWKSEVKKHGIGLNDDLEMLKISMNLADNTKLPMSVIWAAIKNWIEQGMV